MIRTFLFSFLISSPLLAGNVTREIGTSRFVYQIDMQETEMISFQENNLIVQIENIKDLRCPPEMVCFWPGGINFDLTLTLDDSVSKTSLLYIDKKPMILRFEDYDLTITKVTKTKDDYSFHLELIRR